MKATSQAGVASRPIDALAASTSRRTLISLADLAHCRVGDKGDTSTLSLVAYRAEDHAFLVERVTADAVARHLDGIVHGRVRRYELPQLRALQFVCERALSGGVTTSLALDAHGKSLSFALLEMAID